VIASPLGRSRLTGAVDVVVIGAGHSGLAMSRCLSRLAIDHVLLERGEIANSGGTSAGTRCAS
jgi:putative flavoprotein involved in K+ transport